MATTTTTTSSVAFDRAIPPTRGQWINNIDMRFTTPDWHQYVQSLRRQRSAPTGLTPGGSQLGLVGGDVELMQQQPTGALAEEQSLGRNASGRGQSFVV